MYVWKNKEKRKSEKKKRAHYCRIIVDIICLLDKVERITYLRDKVEKDRIIDRGNQVEPIILLH